MRGVFHLCAFFVSLIVGGFLVAAAPSGRVQLPAAIFAAAVAVMFGASALHHRVTWTERGYRWSRRVDHAGVYVAIAGTYTPVGLLVLGGTWRIAVLAVVWGGAAAAIVLKFVWVAAPKWLAAVIAISLGWVAVVVFPRLLDGVGWDGTTLLLVGGLLYTVGGIVYALRRPDPFPTIFGYHEIFHLLVVAAVALQYSVVAFWIVAP
ncbi:MAG TPA: hemolysin III family protein [Gaiellaceae bacterium]|nr:hemolysin III family protein [Gaiellaceae bacterium]